MDVIIMDMGADIKGESSSPGFEKKIELLSFSHGDATDESEFRENVVLSTRRSDYYCKLKSTRISPVPRGNGSKALPINVPGACICLPPIIIGSDFIANPS